MTTTGTTTDTTAPQAASLTLRCPSCGSWNRVRSDRVAAGPKCGKCAAPIALDHPWMLTEESFERTVRETGVPVVVDFYADWCGPCRMMAPAVDQLAKAYSGRALVAKLDTDAAPRVSQQFQIRGIPTTIVFKGGQPVATQSGALPYPALEGMLTRALS